MKTTLIPLLALVLVAGTALGDSHGGRADKRGERRERRGEPCEWQSEQNTRRGGEGRRQTGERRGGERPGGPMSDEMRAEMRADHRAIKELANTARAETDEARKAELVNQLRTKLGEVADRIQAHREERLAQAEERFAGLKDHIEQAKANRDEMIEEQIERILAGERPIRPAAYDRFPHAKGGRGPGEGRPGRGPRDDVPPPPPEE